MGRIQNVSPDARTVADLGNRIVLPGQIVEVPDELVLNFAVQETIWAVADEETAEQHAEQRAAQDEAVAAEQVAREAYAESTRLEEPDGNDSRASWVAWVTGCGLATVEDLEEFGRNEIRDRFRTYDRVDIVTPEPEPPTGEPDVVVDVDTQDPPATDEMSTSGTTTTTEGDSAPQEA